MKIHRYTIILFSLFLSLNSQANPLKCFFTSEKSLPKFVSFTSISENELELKIPSSFLLKLKFESEGAIETGLFGKLNIQFKSLSSDYEYSMNHKVFIGKTKNDGFNIDISYFRPIFTANKTLESTGGITCFFN